MANDMHPVDLDRADRLLDENEQLRTALENALDEASSLIEDRDRLLGRVTVLARELQVSQIARTRVAERESEPEEPPQAAEAVASQTEEELRVAFEELQVLTEELEVANTSLHEANAMLEERVADRTRDVTAANEALKRSEARLSTLIEGIPQLVWRSHNDGDWTWASSQWRDYTGQSTEQSAGQGWLEAYHPDDRDAVRAAWAAAPKQDWLHFGGRIHHAAEQRYRHFRTRAQPVHEPNGEICEWLGTSTDIDDLIQLQERQAILVAELQHRTRNLMAVVQAVMIRTLRGSPDLPEFRAAFEDRLQALGRVQGLLSRRDAGKRISFAMLLRDELAAHVELDAQGNAPQVTTSGPEDVPLKTALIQTFALALHELMTNAVKYGALATETGHLSITWKVVEEGDRSRLLVDWDETGVTDLPQPGAMPRGSGYGRELIERALPYQLGARTSYAFKADGLHCTIELDVAQDRQPTEMVID